MQREHRALPRTTARVDASGLCPDVHELTGQQACDHLVFAVRHTHRTGRSVLDFPHYFKGTGRGQSTHFDFGYAFHNDERPIGDRTTVRFGGRRRRVTRLELPVNVANADRISLHGDSKQVESGRPGILRHNVTFRTQMPGSHGIVMLVVQFATDDDASAFVSFVAGTDE